MLYNIFDIIFAFPCSISVCLKDIFLIADSDAKVFHLNPFDIFDKLCRIKDDYTALNPVNSQATTDAGFSDDVDNLLSFLL